MDDATSPSGIMLEISDGKVWMNGRAVDLGTLIVQHELSRGASGVVFKARDFALEREVAVKFWLKLRKGDMRDKADQGLRESRKTWSAQCEEVARLFFSGYAGDIFYTVMELIHGVTLKDWLAIERPSLGARCHMAERLIKLDAELQAHGVVHGDLHWKNAMVTDDISPRDYFDLSTHKRWNIKLLDFGTSYFSGKPKGHKRHYTVLEETIEHCIAPFVLSELNVSERPNSLDAKDMKAWLLRGLYAIRAAIFQHGHEYVGWPLFRAFGTYELTTKGFNIDLAGTKKTLEALVKNGKLTLTTAELGDTPEWGPFDGRTAQRED